MVPIRGETSAVVVTEQIVDQFQHTAWTVICQTVIDGLAFAARYHQTLKPMWWWSDLFAEYGFRRQVDKESYFDVADAWVRKVRFNFVFRYG